ncbi:hypothetical protein SCUCBS95973_009469 [Sporothrix curviconia]|uniref:Uncharacterized protein n=1 Tax=Sporothrix curviconia TaxID=1260050 RepID=A0ABP0CV97_9PEZI
MAITARRRRRGQGTAANSAALDATTQSSPTVTAVSSSFFTVPSVVFTGVGTFPPWSDAVGRRVYDTIRPRLGEDAHRASCRLLESIFTATAADEGLLAHTWAVLQASVFHKSTAAAIPYFAAAVVVNHARRTFWFGRAAAGFFAARPQPDEDWRLLLARPDVFLEDVAKQVVRRGVLLLVVALLQKRAWDVLAGGLPAAFLLADNADSADSEPRRLVRTVRCRAKDVAATLFLVWLASCVEYAVAQTSATLAIGTAVWKLARSGSRGLLARVVLGASPSLSVPASTTWLVLFAWRQMVVYPWTGLGPMVVRSVARPVRQPGVLLCVVSVALAMATLLRYRSRLYIAIETSGLAPNAA